MQTKGASTPERAAERNRRQREHGRRLREEARLHQLSERQRVQGKLAAAWERCGQRVASSQRRSLLARIKCMLAADKSREAANLATARAQQVAREARERADARRS